ncbi:hypothetical protein [Streptomyces sp. NBC_01443]|uniref:hypothetical protein n=1 Tax=Streptomyces sp. NBC_01443 TaxID=2903868 RepID=UPI00225BCD27|nr:hypothetical protein [Streptomyces sp. NBC_01443]MCX4630183.1 hypothetical protein [Streptomyces sp. NBC_01443]WSW46130.1 hypothetical protein OG296_25200 [Streptomyces sp. NBC_01001]
MPRRAVITVALCVLLGALFLCVRPGEPHAVTAVSGATAATAPAGVSAVRGPAGGHGTRAVCVSPDEPPGCSPFSHVAPGVLPAPPPAVTVAGSAPDPVGRAAGGGPARPNGTLARAPDLHALQVLRT